MSAFGFRRGKLEKGADLYIYRRKTKEFFKTISESLGIKSRTFLLDYMDDQNNFCHIEVNCAIAGVSDAQVIQSLISEMKAKDNIVYGILEVFNGHNLATIERMTKRNPLEAAKHMKLLYFDPDKERA